MKRTDRSKIAAIYFSSLQIVLMFRMQGRSANRLSTFHHSQAIRFYAHYSGPSTSKRTFYEILGVNNKATSTEIKDAFFALSKKFHPDVSKNAKDAHDRFIEINEAYAVLSKPESRMAYDARFRSSYGGGGSFADRGDTSRSSYQWPPEERRDKDVDELYRRYFEELYRRKYRSGREQQTFSGQRQQSPFRDIRRDPPIWGDYVKTSGEERLRNAQRMAEMKRANAIGVAIFRWYIIVVFALLTINTIAELLSWTPEPRSPPPPVVDPKLEERWKRSMSSEDNRRT